MPHTGKPTCKPTAKTNKPESRHARHERDTMRYKCEEHDAWQEYYDLDFTKPTAPVDPTDL